MDPIKENKDEFELFRVQNPIFAYKAYSWKREGNKLILSFTYALSASDVITTDLSFLLPEEVADDAIKAHEDIIFRIGLIESLSYWKAHCSPTVHIECGSLSPEELKWWKDTWYDGLGEFRYRNGLLDVSKDEWVNFTFDDSKNSSAISNTFSKLVGNLIAFTGGKDSTLVLGLLRDSNTGPNETFFVSNASIDREKIKEQLSVSAYPETVIERKMHPRLLELNQSGALNGHTPFSIIVAFAGLLVASLRGLKYVIVGNEASASEPTVAGTDINHQYSKSFEFEKGFQNYCAKLWPDGPAYFSLLRPISEIGIGCMLQKYEETLPYISSCNKRPADKLWCGACAKCLFAHILFSAVFDIPYATKMIGTNMFATEEHFETLRDLCGINPVKPFECVGTMEESSALLAEIYKRKGAMDEPLLAEFWGLHDDTIHKALSFEELASAFHAHAIPEKSYVEILKKVQKDTCHE